MPEEELEGEPVQHEPEEVEDRDKVSSDPTVRKEEHVHEDLLKNIASIEARIDNLSETDVFDQVQHDLKRVETALANADVEKVSAVKERIVRLQQKLAKLKENVKNE
jgi:hypothetical protein